MTYGTIVADPPWPYKLRKKDKTHRNKALVHYDDMTAEEIIALPIEAQADPQGAACWLWTTNNHMVLAHQCLEAWGFEYKTMMTWVKTTNDREKIRIGTGHWLRSATEHCLLGVSKGQKSFSHLGTLGGIPNVILSPRREHSRKPEEMYQVVEALQPETKKIEFFARHHREKWDVWGNQTDKFKAA